MTVRAELIRQAPFQASNAMASLEIVLEDFEQRSDTIDANHPYLVVRLVVWQWHHSPDCKKEHHERPVEHSCFQIIRDVKEQSLFMPKDILGNGLLSHGGRNTNFVTALKNVLADVLSGKDIEARMPADLFPFDPLGKKTFGTVMEFENALRKKGRLGKHLLHPVGFDERCVICQNEGPHDLSDRQHVMEGQE